VPILILSSRQDDAARTEARAAGADDIVSKPIVAADLLERIAAPLERQRVARLAEGRHPGTGIPLATRTLADAAERLREAERTGRAMTAAVIRPAVAELQAETAADWLCESQRLAGALATSRGVVGYVDGVSLFALLEAEVEEAEALCAALAAAPGPAWRVAIIDTDAAGNDVSTLRGAAEDVLGVVRVAEDARVIRWRREEARRAPEVVIVEDDPALTEMIQYVLRLSNLSYRHFRAGDAAIQALLAFETHGERPLVLLDDRLPGLDGHELFAALSARRPGEYAVVFLTEEPNDEQRLRALRAGALDYVAKPVSYRTLLGKVPLWRERARMAMGAQGA
jgi:DNA-binding response OmpR family regulator